MRSTVLRVRRRRVGRVKKFLERLRPRIAEAQGVLSRETYAGAAVPAAAGAPAVADLPPVLVSRFCGCGFR